MSLESELLTLLAADSAVVALAGTRLRYEWLDQNTTLPAVTLMQVSLFPEYALNLANPLNRARIQVDCWARDFESAADLGAAVIAVLHNYSGTVGVYSIDSISLENNRPLGERDGDDIIRRRSIDFFVTYN